MYYLWAYTGFSYILVNNQVESVAPCWEYVVLQWCGTVVGVDNMARLENTKCKSSAVMNEEGQSFLCRQTQGEKMVNLKLPHLFMKMANPLSKLPGVGDRGWQEDVMHIIGEKNDGLLPHNTTLWN